MPAGGRTTLWVPMAEPTMAAHLAGCAPRRRSQASEDCWRSTSPSITCEPRLARQPANCVASVLLPLPPLRLMTATVGMIVEAPGAFQEEYVTSLETAG